MRSASAFPHNYYLPSLKLRIKNRWQKPGDKYCPECKWLSGAQQQNNEYCPYGHGLNMPLEDFMINDLDGLVADL